MKKLIITMISICLVAAMFVGCGGSNTDPTAAPTNSATSAPTAEPTPTPVPTATPVPRPTIQPDLVDAIITSFDEFDESYCNFNLCEGYIDGQNPFLTVTIDSGDVWFSVPFTETANVDQYPILAIKYKTSYGTTINAGSHLYAITTGGGPSQESGWWTHPSFVEDGDWHVLTLNMAEVFGPAGKDFTGMRMPCISNTGKNQYIAYMGAFKTLEDVEIYDAAHKAAYADVLVADEPPSDKNESTPDTVDKFTEHTETFDDFYDTKITLLAGSEFEEFFKIAMGNNTSSLVTKDDNIVCNLTFDAISYTERAKSGSAYTLNFKLKTDNSALNFGGFIINYGHENNESGSFFETNGLRGDGAGSLVGNSGIGVTFKAGGVVEIYVLTFGSNNKLGFISYEVDTGINFSTDFQNITVIDDGKGVVTLKANDTLIATVNYSNDGLLPAAAAAYNERYYRTASICDASGNKVAETDSALISYTKAFGFGGRSHSILLDDISIKNN